MRLSRFNIWVEGHPAAGEYLLFNSRTQALIKVSREFKRELEEAISPQSTVHSPQVMQGLPALKESGIIVEDEQEEELKLKDFFRQLKYESHALAFEATILTTYSCNFRCVYCFEESVKNNLFLGKSTSDAIIKWLIARAQKRNFKKAFLVFYGGEPLLNTEPIYHISREVKEWAAKNGVGFGFAMITNGSLLTPNLIEDLRGLGLRTIRISIDGDRLAHNRKRPFLDGRPSFDVIIKNIKDIIDKVDVEITGNFDRLNYDSIPRLLDYLEQVGLFQKLSRLDFAPLVPRLGAKSNPGAIELSECLSYIGEEGLFNEVIAIKKEIMRRGKSIPTGLAINACTLMMQDGGVAIDPRGDIYKCNSLLGYPEFSIGNVRAPEFNENYQRFLDIDAWNKCAKDCPYIPMCQGGCRFFSYVEHKNFSDLACKKPYLDRIIPELIKLEYEKLLKERTTQ